MSGHPRKKGAESHSWKGGRVKMGPDNYIGLFMPDHPRSNANGYVREHVVIAEKALGKPLPAGAIAHHVDEDQARNVNSNLVICRDARYHRILHGRMSIAKAGGSPDLHRICGRCKRVLSKSIFPRLRRKWDGIGKMCKSCVSTENRDRYVRGLK